MEKNKTQIGIEKIQNIKMTLEEKENILSNIFSTPPPMTKPIESPYSFISIFQKNHFAYYGAAFCLVLILSGGGIVLNSQKSLPGNALYPVKVGVLEPFNSFLKLSPENKAQYESSLVQERFVEAETLASQGKLDATKEKQINNLLAIHTTAFNKAVNEIKEGKPSEKANTLAINFQDKIKEHTQTLETITDKKGQENGNETENIQIAKIDSKGVRENKKNGSPESFSVASIPATNSSQSPVNAAAPTIRRINPDGNQKTYQGPGFSFNYRADANITSGTIPYGYYAEISNENNFNSIHFYPNVLPENFRPGFFTETIILNGKTFYFGDVKTENGTERSYMYIKDGKTIVIQNDYLIDLSSIEIN